MTFIKTTIAAATVALAGVASAATVDIVTTGSGVGSTARNGDAATVEFAITYRPFTDGFNNPACETSDFSCVDSIVIDLRAGPRETNATAAAFAYLGTVPIDDNGSDFTFTLSDDASVLTIDFGDGIFDPGNQLVFSADIARFGDNSGDAFELREVGALFVFENGAERDATFADNGLDSSIASTVAPIPLPASALLLLAGIGGLGLMRRRGT